MKRIIIALTAPLGLLTAHAYEYPYLVLQTTDDTVTAVGVESLTLTVERAEALLLERNAEVRMARIEVGEAEALLQQEYLPENPEVGILYNVYNPLTNRYFDPGREGELYIEVEQPLRLGGQRSERIRRQRSLTDAISHSRDWTEWQQRMALHRLMAETSVLQEKTAVYGKEMDAADRLLKAYRRQAEQGNASQVEVMRLEALKLRLMGEHSELTASLEEKKKELRQMLALPDSLTFRTDSLALAAPTDTSCEAVASRPDLLALQSAAQAAEHDLRLQRANSLPHIALKAEYDKNGNICRDFWGVGLSMTVPLLNRNQGQVRQSAKALERARLEVETATQRAKTELAYCYGELLRKQRLLDEAGKMSVATWQPDAAERSLLNHNLSMVEFIDLLDAWRESRLLLIDVRGEVLQAAINLNEAAGTDMVKWK